MLARAPRDAEDDAEPVRQLRNLTWGLVPSWAKDPKIGNRILCTNQGRRASLGAAAETRQATEDAVDPVGVGVVLGRDRS